MLSWIMQARLYSSIVGEGRLQMTKEEETGHGIILTTTVCLPFAARANEAIFPDIPTHLSQASPLPSDDGTVIYCATHFSGKILHGLRIVWFSKDCSTPVPISSRDVKSSSNIWWARGSPFLGQALGLANKAFIHGFH